MTNTDIDHELRSAIAMLRTAIDTLTDIRTRIGATSRVLFCSPVTGTFGCEASPFGGDWFDATGFAKLYNSSGVAGYHTGVDLNRPSYLDSGSNVFAAADGVVRFAGVTAGWQRDVVVLEHVLENGVHVWTRYAHIVYDESIVPGCALTRGALLGVVADYNRDGPRGDHLHFDVARIDLGAKPGDWPGNDCTRVLRDYIDPAKWLLERAR